MFEGFKVLFVEDDPPVRASLTQTLELAGLEVCACASAEAALPHIQAGAQLIVATDVRLPGMDGLALLDHVVATDPDIPVVLDGAWRRGDAVRAMAAGSDFLKPFARRFRPVVRR
ncbi:response regulator [Roseateles sp. GG27B]